MKTILILIIGVVSLSLDAPPAKAAIVTTGDWEHGVAEGDTPLPELTFTADISFQIQQASEIRFLVFDDWLPGDPGGTATTQLFPPDGIYYQINGGTIQLSNVVGFFYSWGPSGDMMPRDGGFAFIEAIPISEGDVFTIVAHTYRLGSLISFGSGDLSLTPTLFEGPAFVSNSQGTSLGRIANVPEPSVPILGMVAGLALLRRRVRRGANGHPAGGG
ncbi:hypothetical protein KBB96_09430 [Luteolibacter ambystomatis]|uniref:PEP-CTERM sorting domain-containing protein n=1 Tax=Luteolibacter ambystomatis TaxID=2824561 RepID=A0A975J2Z6_9BACT|nr:hypothetical protein [Luteolibacter ambystomatis]QUE53100.1 hypothetical protein KBB96_09430 [Luteolibacter ambystomatis]